MTPALVAGIAGVFVGSALLAWVLTPVALRFAIAHSALDRPGGHKRHDEAVPYLGGLAMVVAFALAVLAAAVVLPVSGVLADVGLILGLGVLLAVLGLWDDLRGVPIWVRLTAQTLAGTSLHAAGLGVLLFGGGVADAVITVLWIVGVTNALNLLDNMDGLSAGTAAIAAAAISVIAVVNGQVLVAALAAGLAGCALGFLRHNRYPATIYMGDAGSLFLGFLLAAVAIKLRFDAPSHVTFLVPILILGVPLFDTALVVASRLVHGRSAFRGGRDHTSHRLVALGLPVPVAVGTIHVTGAALGWVALLVSRLETVSAYMLFGLAVVLGGLLAWLLWRVPVYDNSPIPERLLRYVSHDEPGEPPDQSSSPISR